MKKEYITYELEDLLEDKEFMSWVTGLNEEEVIAFYDGIDRHKLSSILLAQSLLTPNLQKVNHSINKDDIWKRVSQQTQVSQKSLGSKASLGIRKLYVAMASIAASMIIGWVTLSHFTNPMVNIRAPYGTITTHVLPDGSTVTLNANATLSYDKDFSAKRDISLSGEAFFEVKRGSTFTVKTTLGNVEVLGTSFNVIVEEKNFEVICKSGKVLVYNTMIKKESVLLPGQMVSYTNNIWTDISNDQEIMWRNKRQVFNNKNIIHVANKIENYYGKPIKISENNDSLFYTGQISLENIEKSIEELTWPFRLQYKISKDTIYIGGF